MYFVDRCHQAGIGVIVDWVPAHFPKDAHGLGLLRRHRALRTRRPAQGRARDWGTLIFNYGRNEVREFLISNALFWLKKYHIDGLRVDAVASMLYLDYSRKAGEWIPNEYGGRENLEAIDFLRTLQRTGAQGARRPDHRRGVHRLPGVSRPVYLGGLGFTSSGTWAGCTTCWTTSRRPGLPQVPPQQHHLQPALRLHTRTSCCPSRTTKWCTARASLLGKMPGDEWQRFANARAFLAYMYGHPGKKLLFMGCGDRPVRGVEPASRRCAGNCLSSHYHRALQALVRELNRLYRNEPALHQVDYPLGRLRVDRFPRHRATRSSSFLRRAEDPAISCCSLQFHPGAAHELPRRRARGRLLRGDPEQRRGDVRRQQRRQRRDGFPRQRATHDRRQSISITLPPMAVVAFRVRQ